MFESPFKVHESRHCLPVQNWAHLEINLKINRKFAPAKVPEIWKKIGETKAVPSCSVVTFMEKWLPAASQVTIWPSGASARYPAAVGCCFFEVPKLKKHQSWRKACFSLAKHNSDGDLLRTSKWINGDLLATIEKRPMKSFCWFSKCFNMPHFYITKKKKMLTWCKWYGYKML